LVLISQGGTILEHSEYINLLPVRNFVDNQVAL